MIGIDTNVLIRYLVRDDLAQAQEASRIIERQSVPIYVNTLVLCELVWVLESAYECTKKSIASVLIACHHDKANSILPILLNMKISWLFL